MTVNIYNLNLYYYLNLTFNYINCITLLALSYFEQQIILVIKCNWSWTKAFPSFFFIDSRIYSAPSGGGSILFNSWKWKVSNPLEEIELINNMLNYLIYWTCRKIQIQSILWAISSQLTQKTNHVDFSPSCTVLSRNKCPLHQTLYRKTCDAWLCFVRNWKKNRGLRNQDRGLAQLTVEILR